MWNISENKSVKFQVGCWENSEKL